MQSSSSLFLVTNKTVFSTWSKTLSRMVRLGVVGHLTLLVLQSEIYKLFLGKTVLSHNN